MAKTYIDIVKYMVEAKFEITGLVEKPDIIGAVFGQTEGLLGADLDLRELQKNGKIGRIEIETQPQGNRTVGRLHLPSSLGKVETCILAAAVESVDRVGPFETHFKIEKVEDTRSEKRNKIVNRAKELVKNLLATGMPDSRELSELVEVDVKSSVVTEYGPEKLAAGPDIASSDDIVLVEGRADVITLLKSDITNCIAVGGASGTIPKTIVDLLKTKETTLFLDGDRGGDLILRGITNAGEIDYFARAPDGKEVEELTRKEIIKALRSRVPIEQVHGMKKNVDANSNRDDRSAQPRQAAQYRSVPAQRQPPQQMQQQQRMQIGVAPGQPGRILSPSDIVSNMTSQAKQPPALERDEDDSFNTDDLDIKDLRQEAGRPARPMEGIPNIGGPSRAGAGPSALGQPNPNMVTALNELHNTLRGRLYTSSGELITEVPIRELIQAVQDTKNANAIVFDGIITQRLIELAFKSGVREVYGIRANQITRMFEGMLLYTKEHGKL